MRSPYTQLLALPRHNLSFGSRAFRISPPKNWNTLPLVVCQSHSLSTFRNRLKNKLFQISLCVLLATCHQCALILLETSALYKLFTYLLNTYLPLDDLLFCELPCSTADRTCSSSTNFNISSTFSLSGRFVNAFTLMSNIAHLYHHRCRHSSKHLCIFAVYGAK